MESPTSPPNVLNFIFGGLAGMMACTVVHPLDLLKNRMQLSGMGGTRREHKTSLHLAGHIVHSEGVGALYNGLTASLLRQATYTTARLGIFNMLLDFAKGEDGVPANFMQKAGFGVVAGVCGAFVGTPADICLIRMTADGRLPPAERRNYKNVFNALVRIVREEGVLTLWRGCVPTMTRAIVVNVAQLATYSQAKQMLLDKKYLNDNIFCHFWASMISGFVTASSSLPIDIVKTRVQNMKTVIGVPQYKGSMDALTTILRKEGLLALWKGFTPYYARIGPQTVLTFVFLEQLWNLYRSYVS